MQDANLIIKEVTDYIVNYIERPSDVFGGFPVCPFSKKHRLAGEINFVVLDFSLADDIDPRVTSLVQQFLEQTHHKSLFVIHPDKTLDQNALARFCNTLQAALHPLGLLLFRGHPKDTFKVGDQYTRREPYPGFQLLHQTLITQTRAKLNPAYFKNWSPEALKEVLKD